MAIAAGIVGDAHMGAVLAPLDVAAERLGATNLDRRHDAALGEAQMSLVRSTPGGPMAAEDIRHLQTRPGHAGLSGRRHRLDIQAFERAVDLPDSSIATRV